MLVNSARILLKRWVWVLLALVVAMAAGVGTFTLVTPMQESKAQVLLLPSNTEPGVDGPTNPFLSLGGSVAIVASVVQVAVTDQTSAQKLYDGGARAKYKVEPNLAENAGPVLLVTVDDKSAAMSESTMAAVVQAIKDQLLSIQNDRNVSKTLLITAVVLTQSPHPLPVRKTQTQLTILAAAGVLVILLVVLLLIERRRIRRSVRPAATATSDVAEAVSAPRTRTASSRSPSPARAARNARTGTRGRSRAGGPDQVQSWTEADPRPDEYANGVGAGTPRR
jgi:capsular polysaccharide biosynthesis protein